MVIIVLYQTATFLHPTGPQQVAAYRGAKHCETIQIELPDLELQRKSRDTYPAGQETPRFYQTQSIIAMFTKARHWTLSHFNQVHTLMLHFSCIHFNIISSLCPGHQIIFHKYFIRISDSPNARYMSRQFHLYSFNHSKMMWSPHL
jgi:hypothetical protein